MISVHEHDKTQRGLVWLLALAGSLGLAGVAGAAPTRARAELEFVSRVAQPSCPGERELRDAVVSRLGYDPFVNRAESRVQVTLTERDGTVRAALRFSLSEAAPTERELSTLSADCAELGESLAVSIALTLDPLGSVSPEPAQPPETPAAVKPEAPARAKPRAGTPKAVPSRAEPPKAAPPMRVALNVGPQLSIGRGPAPTYGGRVGVQLEQPSSAEHALSGSVRSVGAELLFESTPGYVAAEQERVRLMLAGLSLLGCHRAPRHVLCLFGSVGMLEGQAEDGEGSARLLDADSKRSLAVFVGGRVGVALPLGGGVALEHALDVFVNAVRTELLVDERAVWTAPVGGATFGIGLRFLP